MTAVTLECDGESASKSKTRPVCAGAKGVRKKRLTAPVADHLKRLPLEVSNGASGAGDEMKVSGSGVLYGVVRAPQGAVTVEGNGRIRGTVTCGYLFVNGDGVLQITENDFPPPPVNRPPTADAGPHYTITLPADTAALEGSASDDGLLEGFAPGDEIELAPEEPPGFRVTRRGGAVCV